MDEMEQQLMVIDTDGGADDALALLVVFNQKLGSNWKVLAITTVHGNVDVDQATGNILRILNFVKKTEIPVYKGCHSSMVHDYFRDDYYGADGMSDCSHKYPLPEGCGPQPEIAVEALIRLAKEHPKQITLVCLGPLTNVALAHKLDRNFHENVKQLFIMGGNMQGIGNITSCAEFNFLCDCEAADITINEFQCPKTIVTWEVCNSHLQSWEWFNEWTTKDNEMSKFVALVLATAAARQNADGEREFHCCDLLAMTAFVDPSVVLESVDRHARVELCGKHTRGMMAIEQPTLSDLKPNVTLHTAYDNDAVRRAWDALTD